MTSAPPSIALITYSAADTRYLEAAIRSTLAQNYPSLQFSLIDAAADHASIATIRRYDAHLARCVSARGLDEAFALSEAFAHTHGDIMGRLYPDDLLLPGALHAVGAFFAAHPEALAVYGDAIWIDPAGRYLRGRREMPFNRFVFRYDRNFIPRSSMFWRRSLYEAVGGIDCRLDRGHDVDLWDRFAERTRIRHLSHYLSCTRRRTDQEMSESRHAAHARAGLEPVLKPFARVLRLAMRASVGAFRADAPPSLVGWLHTTRHSAIDERDDFARVLSV